MFHHTATIISQITPPTENLGAIYIGSADAAESAAIIATKNINVIVTILSEEELVGFTPSKGQYTQYIYNIVDCEGIITQIAERAYAVINDAVANKLNVLVHCAMGVSRSVSVVLYYLMKTNKWSWKQAWKFIKTKRKCASPCPIYRKQLQSIKF